MVQFLSRWLTSAQTERVVYGYHVLAVGIVFAFLAIVTIFAR